MICKPNLIEQTADLIVILTANKDPEKLIDYSHLI